MLLSNNQYNTIVCLSSITAPIMFGVIPQARNNPIRKIKHHDGMSCSTKLKIVWEVSAPLYLSNSLLHPIHYPHFH